MPLLLFAIEEPPPCNPYESLQSVIEAISHSQLGASLFQNSMLSGFNNFPLSSPSSLFFSFPKFFTKKWKPWTKCMICTANTAGQTAMSKSVLQGSICQRLSFGQTAICKAILQGSSSQRLSSIFSVILCKNSTKGFSGSKTGSPRSWVGKPKWIRLYYIKESNWMQMHIKLFRIDGSVTAMKHKCY